ncbi:MAG: hypothetical protein ABI641_12185 [Caldimonas sp.]
MTFTSDSAPIAVLAFLAALTAPAAAAAADAAPTPPGQTAPCPQGVAAGSRCVSGRDSEGAYYWLAVPRAWNGVLVVHAHGGPALGVPKASRPVEDLHRWSIWTRAGYAYAASGYRQGGVAVTSAAEDTERVRRIFVAEYGMPRRTILHGQSWGAGVAAKAAEMYAGPSSLRSPYDGVLLTSGVLGGGSHSYDFRLDLRVVYEAVCANHPLPSEPAYPLWQGLPADSELTRAELARRVDDCTGVRHPPAQRTAAQQQRLDTLTRVIHIPERSLIGHLNWATWHFQDIAAKRAGGGNPFGNEGVHYQGSAGDAALNAAVLRYRADPAAKAMFAADTDPTGRIGVPVLSMHAIDDPTAFVELESTFRDTMAAGGSADRLVQVVTDDHEHSYLSDAEYVAAMAALLAWVERGDKPTPQGIAASCSRVDARFEPTKGCRFLPDFTTPPLSTRTPPR